MTFRAHPTLSTGQGERPGDDLLRPLVLVAIGVLLLNDHLLKSAAPGWLTGKVSDAAGLFAMPFAIRALTEVALARQRTWCGQSLPVLVAAAIAVGTGFAAIKLVPAAAAAFGWTLAWAHQVPSIVTARWAPEILSAATQLAPAGPAPVVRDPSDLLMLPALGVALLVGGAGHWFIRMGRGTAAWVRARRLPGRTSMFVSWMLVAAVSLAGCVGHAEGTPPPNPGSETTPMAVSQEDAVGAVIDWIVGQGELPAIVYVEEAVHEDLLGFAATVIRARGDVPRLRDRCHWSSCDTSAVILPLPRQTCAVSPVRAPDRRGVAQWWRTGFGSRWGVGGLGAGPSKHKPLSAVGTDYQGYASPHPSSGGHLSLGRDGRGRPPRPRAFHIGLAGSQVRTPPHGGT